MDDEPNVFPPISRSWVPWLILVLAFLFANVGSVLYDLAQQAPPPLFRFAMMAAVWYWFWRYHVARSIPFHIDDGLFLAMVPYVMIPVQVIRAEKWRSLLTFGGLLTVYVATYAIAAVIYYTATGF